MDLLTRAAEKNETVDPQELLSAIPYAQHLGVRAGIANGILTLTMPFSQHLVGNVALPALHGGVIGSLLETAAIAQVVWERRGLRLPKPVDITIDYLRSGRPVTSYARARIAKEGRRVVNVHAEMWQEDEAKPIAALRGHFLIVAG
jgi:uncharacterized protein (TIGR00369 family)